MGCPITSLACVEHPTYAYSDLSRTNDSILTDMEHMQHVMALDAAFATADVFINPLSAGSKLVELLKALQHAAETAEQCQDICQRVLERAIARAPILSDLILQGSLYPDENVELNRALNLTLWQAVATIGDACDVLYSYMQHGPVAKWAHAKFLRHALEKKRELLFDRLEDIQAHVQYSPNKKVMQGAAVASKIGSAVDVLRAELQDLRRWMRYVQSFRPQNLRVADRDEVRSVAAANTCRRKSHGQKPQSSARTSANAC